MDFLGGLMGGGNEGRREEYQDFARRYDEGAPYDRISDEEAHSRYREVAPNLSEDDYRHSAREAFERMSPEERREFGRMLQEESRGRGDFGGDEGRYDDPDYLAGQMARMHGQQPDAMTQLLGGMMGTGGSGLMGGALGGMMGGSGARAGSGGMMSNPVAKAAVAGIAAMAVKRAMGGR